MKYQKKSYLKQVEISKICSKMHLSMQKTGQEHVRKFKKYPQSKELF